MRPNARKSGNSSSKLSHKAKLQRKNYTAKEGTVQTFPESGSLHRFRSNFDRTYSLTHQRSRWTRFLSILIFLLFTLTFHGLKSRGCVFFQILLPCAYFYFLRRSFLPRRSALLFCIYIFISAIPVWPCFIYR